MAPGGLKKQVSRRKHWPLVCNIQLPKAEDSLRIETNTQIKVKQLKELIKEKTPSLSDINIDRILLHIEGGDALKKNSA
jgi:hypothetical protein